MTNLDAWHALFRLWHCPEWTPIPEAIREALRLDTRLGMFRGSLVTRAGAAGIEEFIKRMNKRNH